MDNLCIYGLGCLFILCLISQHNNPDLLGDFIFSNLGLLTSVLLIVLLFNMNNSLILTIGIFILLIIFVKYVLLEQTNNSIIHDQSVITNRVYESSAFDSCKSTFNCKDKDNLEVISVQSMLPYVDDSIVESKSSWKPILCKPIVK